MGRLEIERDRDNHFLFLMVHVQSFKLRLYQFFLSREQKILTSRSYLKALALHRNCRSGSNEFQLGFLGTKERSSKSPPFDRTTALTGRNGNDFRQCQILNEKSNYSCCSRSLGELWTIVREARVEGDLSMPAFQTSSRYSLGQLAPHTPGPRGGLAVVGQWQQHGIWKHLSWVEPL